MAGFDHSQLGQNALTGDLHLEGNPLHIYRNDLIDTGLLSIFFITPLS